jgi:hypothetical protein
VKVYAFLSFSLSFILFFGLERGFSGKLCFKKEKKAVLPAAHLLMTSGCGYGGGG